MEKTIISDLYAEGISRAELILPKGEEYQRCCGKRTEKEKKLMDNLSKEQQQLFDDFMCAYSEVGAHHDQENFRQGVALGIRITAEAFLLGD